MANTSGSGSASFFYNRGLKPLSSSALFLFADDLPEEQLEAGIVRQIMGHDESILMARVQFETGAVGYVHSHVHSQTTYVESGEFEVTIGDTTRLVSGGDALYMPPNVPHGSVCRSAGVLIDVFSRPGMTFSK